jgi:hypothetical protein
VVAISVLVGVATGTAVAVREKLLTATLAYAVLANEM